ncbi:MAG: hypothetical protein DMF69_08115, partial [Acidobacteria bacterium]
MTDSSATSVPPEQSTAEWFQTDSGVVLGTLAYMSPEQTRGLTVDARTDIWSLGVVLYEMTVGSLPFTGPTRSDVMVSILERNLPALQDDVFGHSVELRRILDKALRKRTSERYETAREFLEDLKKLRSGLDTHGKQKVHGSFRHGKLVAF